MAGDSWSDKKVEKEEHGGGGQGDNLIRHWEGCHGNDTKPRPPRGTLLRLFLASLEEDFPPAKEYRSISSETPKWQVSQHHRPLQGMLLSGRGTMAVQILEERDKGKRFL